MKLVINFPMTHCDYKAQVSAPPVLVVLGLVDVAAAAWMWVALRGQQ